MTDFLKEIALKIKFGKREKEKSFGKVCLDELTELKWIKWKKSSEKAG